MTERAKKTVQDEVTLQFITDYGYHVIEKIEEGHIGLPIFRCVNSDGDKRVVKVGSGIEGKREVGDNLYGYSSLSSIGASIFVPEGVKVINTPWGDAIDMPDLGVNFTKSSRSETETRGNFEVLGRTLLDAIKSTKVKNKLTHANGVTETVFQLKKWTNLLVEKGVAKNEVLEIIDDLEPETFSGNYASIMLFDFTPDNVFVNGGCAKFIDPWRQKDYLGTIVPSVSQFITLSEDVYKIPGFNNPNLEYNTLVDEIGNELELDQEKLEAQVNLGKALQYSLSSYVRIASNPKMSEFYAGLSRKNIERMRN